jgi:hypothetical protein
MLFLVFILISGFYGKAAAAIPPCSLDALTESIEMLDASFGKSERDAIEKVFCNVQAIAARAQPIRVHLTDTKMGFVYPNDLFIESHFKPQTTLGSGFQQSLEKSGALWAHEYAHAVLSSRLLPSHADWAQSYARSVELEKLYDRLKQCEEQRPICPEFRSLIKERLTFWNPGEFEKVDEFMSAYVPYDELFADSVSVLVFSDPSAVTKALSFPGMDLVDASAAALRDFSIPHQTTDGLPSEGHGLLAPSRYWLWKNRFSKIRPNDLHAKTEALSLLSSAIETEVVRRLANHKVSTPQEINENLLSALNPNPAAN